MDKKILITEDEYNQLLKFQGIKDYHHQYFQNKLKEYEKYCPCCKSSYKYNSFYNHLKSKKHLKKLEEINKNI